MVVATEASDEGDGFTEFCAGSDRILHNELHCSVLPEEAEKSGMHGRICRFIKFTAVISGSKSSVVMWEEALIGHEKLL